MPLKYNSPTPLSPTKSHFLNLYIFDSSLFFSVFFFIGTIILFSSLISCQIFFNEVMNPLAVGGAVAVAIAIIFVSSVKILKQLCQKHEKEIQGNPLCNNDQQKLISPSSFGGSMAAPE